jgi:hypothetical protein
MEQHPKTRGSVAGEAVPGPDSARSVGAGHARPARPLGKSTRSRHREHEPFFFLRVIGVVDRKGETRDVNRFHNDR